MKRRGNSCSEVQLGGFGTETGTKTRWHAQLAQNPPPVKPMPHRTKSFDFTEGLSNVLDKIKTLAAQGRSLCRHQGFIQSI